MAIGTDHRTNTTEDKFIPELWSDDVIANYKANLILQPLVTIINHNKQKGDTIHIPKPVRGSANEKVVETQVTLNATVATEQLVYINKWYEYSHLIEDITAIQALDSMRKFYTDDAGYQLAIQVDSDLFALGADFQGGANYSGAVSGADGTTAWDPSADTNAGNGGSLTDEGIRECMLKLDNLDVPLNGRAWVVPPVEKKSLLGIDRFTEQSFTGEMGDGNSIRNGMIGDLYGTPVYVTTTVPTVTADDTTTDYRAAVYIHKGAITHAEQLGIRTQSDYELAYLGDLFVADTIYGVAMLRDASAISVMVPA